MYDSHMIDNRVLIPKNRPMKIMLREGKGDLKVIMPEEISSSKEVPHSKNRSKPKLTEKQAKLKLNEGVRDLFKSQN